MPLHNRYCSGGLYKAVLEADEIGAKAFGMFLKSQRQWNSKPLDEKAAQKFRETCLVCTPSCIRYLLFCT